MALTLLFESKSADTGTDFFWKIMGYRMHGTHIRFGYSPLLSSPFPSFPAVSTVLTASLLVSVTGVEVAETNTRFWPLGILGGVISLLVTAIILDLGDIFQFFFDNAGVNTCCRGVVAITSSLALLVLKTSLLVVLVHFWIR